MRAITVKPGEAGSARLDDIPDPEVSDGSVLVRTRALGICGTDRDIVAGHYGWAPAGATRLILGHESLGVVLDAPKDSGLTKGDLVVGIVRRPDPVPCPACAIGNWDMCRNGRYSERGIKERDGYGAELFRIEPEFTVKLDRDLGALGVLVEPASIVAKAWDHVMRIGGRAGDWQPRTLLVTGAGPVGLLAALMGHQQGLDVHVFDRAEDGAKPALVRSLGGTYHSGGVEEIEDLAPDIIMECTGAPSLIHLLLGRTAAAGVMCLAGVSNPGRALALDIGRLNWTLVLDNNVVFGSVNANRRHYEMAAAALGRADPKWLAGMITRCVPLDHWSEALQFRPDDIKVVIDMGRA